MLQHRQPYWSTPTSYRRQDNNQRQTTYKQQQPPYYQREPPVENKKWIPYVPLTVPNNNTHPYTAYQPYTYLPDSQPPNYKAVATSP